jgi:polyvinyl alcohol dehydrogenase (cytochrome)
MIALDLATGTQLWKTYTVEDGYRGKDKFPGVAVWGGAPAIDASDDSVYFATGNNYEAPPEVEQCETNRRACMANATAAALGCGFGGDCLPKDKVHYNAIIKVDIATGAIKWASTFADYEAWNLACFLGAYGPNPANCPVVAGPDYDFGQGPMLLRIPVKGQMTDAVGAGQKSGIFWMLRRDNGQVIWETQVAPGGALGGLEFGSATDGRTIYTASANFENKRHVLVDGSVTYAGSWAAIDAWTGRIKWQRAIPGAEKAKCGYCGTPQGSNCDAGTQCVVFTGDYTALQTTGHLRRGLGAVTYANGIMYASTYDDQGDLYALDANTGDILWSYKTGAGNICGPAVSNGTVYWGIGYSRLPGGVAGDKGLMALAPPSVTGTQQYSADIPSSGSSSTPGSVTNDYRP